MAPSIKITPSPVMINVDADPPQTSGEARVSYHADFTPYLWERILGNPWTHPSLDSSHQWTITLNPGDIYQVLMYDWLDADPNVAIDDPVSPLATATTVGLPKRTPTTLITADPEAFFAGGTYVQWRPKTTTPTRAVMQVGLDEPDQDADGVEVIANPIWTVEEDFTNFHTLLFGSDARPLLPGTDYWATLLVFDAAGRWQSVKQPFTTRKRTVEIILQEIHIIDDGSPGHNDASFRLWICEGDTFVSACALPEQEISDRPSPGEEYMEHIGLSAACVVPLRFGPSAVTAERRRVSILTRGIAKSTFGKDDISGNFDPDNGFPDNPPLQSSIRDHAFLYLPAGPDEALDEAEFTTYADPLNNPDDNEFSYEVIGVYSVKYDP
jgi:hypothetical protein